MSTVRNRRVHTACQSRSGRVRGEHLVLGRTGAGDWSECLEASPSSPRLPVHLVAAEAAPVWYPPQCYHASGSSRPSAGGGGGGVYA